MSINGRHSAKSATLLRLTPAGPGAWYEPWGGHYTRASNPRCCEALSHGSDPSGKQFRRDTSTLGWRRQNTPSCYKELGCLV
ncbi:hypothetical protein N7478_005199 [Penicillium angulare]|uniref:uncharacterized protein n=1 Tax=Penicillium angulare TaxID=116970 RepID=UPI002541883A|nr:uncharacterized protein N7478_005199 [Penicillium angulare]KAJ5279827.1 hypothetical protein N7478_005199 [Penicillium angulare]